MEFHLHRPGPPLGRLVETVTYYSGYLPAHSRERLLPDGAVEIVVDLGDTPKRLFDSGASSGSAGDSGRGGEEAAARSLRGAWISGMRRDWITIEAAANMEMVVIRFRAGGAYPVLGFAVEALSDAVEELDQVLGPGARSLRDRLIEAPTPAAKMRAVEGWLLERVGHRLALHPAVEHLAARLHAPGNLRIAEVAGEAGYSQRHLASLFRRWLGLPPKPYARIRRFQQAVETLARSPGAEPEWADLALACGYYDQSHLISEFRRFSGLTPSGYLAAQGEYLNYLPLD